jgi:choline/glycine/proline betaine transport protein
MNNLSKPRFLISIFLLSLITAIVSLNSDISESFFLNLQAFLSKYLGWMIILIANGFVIFAFFLIFTKYKDIRLGGVDAKPAYSYVNWIAMLFSAGLGIGLLFYGVAEPIMHLNSYPGMIEGDSSFNAGKAIGLANLHWGLHGWAIYSLLGLCFAFASYNKKLPFRVSSLLGPKISNNKPLAISIDIIAILTTVLGVTTSLGLGTIQISSGLEYVFSIPQSFSNQIIIISLITLIGLTSVCLGLDKGIKRLSQINMILATSLMAFIFIFGPTVFILNALIQNFGSYVNTLIESATWTEVYSSSSWQDGWTLFFYTWWFAWAPFVSLFIARISYGRSIKEFIIGVLFVPSLIVFLWMGIFGNAGIYQVINETSQLNEIVNNNYTVALFALFDVYPIPTLISILALTIIVTFFVTSSDSGALVASMLSSKSHLGIHDDSPILSRVTWAILLGIIAAVLLYKGGLTALQTSVVICGVPFSIIVVFAIRHFYNSLESELDKN